MKNRIDFISFEEFQQLYKKCNDKELKLAMLLGFGSGLRISEIIGYQRKFKFKKKIKSEDTSTIPSLTADKIDLDKHQIRIDDAKGGKWRVTVTSPQLKPEHLKLLPLKVKRRTLQYQFDALCKRVLNKEMSFHILRHGFGNYMVNVLKLPLPMVQQYMGHSSIAVTGIYARANPESAIREAWKAMGGAEDYFYARIINSLRRR
jgi:integrase